MNFHKQRSTLLRDELTTNGGRGSKICCSYAVFRGSSEGRRQGETWAAETHIWLIFVWGWRPLWIKMEKHRKPMVWRSISFFAWELYALLMELYSLGLCCSFEHILSNGCSQSRAWDNPNVWHAFLKVSDIKIVAEGSILPLTWIIPSNM